MNRITFYLLIVSVLSFTACSRHCEKHKLDYSNGYDSGKTWGSNMSVTRMDAWKMATGVDDVSGAMLDGDEYHCFCEGYEDGKSDKSKQY